MDVHRSYRHLPFTVLDLSSELGTIGLIELGHRHPHEVIVVNATAASINGIEKHNQNLVTDLAVLDRQLITLWAIDRLASSLDSLERYINAMNGRTVHVVMNSFFGDSGYFKSYQKSAIKIQVELTGESLVLPLLNSHVCDKLFNEDSTIEDAATGMLLGYRSVLNGWRKKCRVIFDSISILTQPQRILARTEILAIDISISRLQADDPTDSTECRSQVEDIWDEFLRLQISSETKRTYAGAIDNFFRLITGSPSTPRQIAEFLRLSQYDAIAIVLKDKADLLDLNLAPSTINVIHLA